MTTLDLLRTLYVHGVDVTLNSEGGIRVSGSPPPPDVMDALKANRDAVLDLLREHHIGTSDDGYPSLIARRYVTPSGCLTPRLCARLGPCSTFLLRRPCDGSEGTS